MRPALLALLSALAVAWYLPAPLTRLTVHGANARLGLAAWLTAMASVLALLLVSLQFLIRAAVAGWPGLAKAVCRSVAGGACGPSVYQSAIFELALGLATLAAALTLAVLGWRYGRSVQQGQRRTRAHAEFARMTARRLPDAGAGPGAAVVLDAAPRVAYCVPGRPATIVLSSGALAVLDPAQLTAVLAHERAHLAGRHHLLISLTRALRASFPAVPLFTQGPGEVARLAEMCADDAAARRTGRGTLVAALLAMGTGAAVPAAALAATGGATLARVQRLLEPPRRARRARCGLALTTVTLGLAVMPVLVAAFAGALLVPGVVAG
jgi:beta-lactamase regulating signal transducer with metallopeptidase domain